MGLIGKIGLIGVVAVAVTVAVIWDSHNQSKIVAPEKVSAAENSSITQSQPSNPNTIQLTPKSTQSPETQPPSETLTQNQTPTEQPVENREKEITPSAPIKTPEPHPQVTASKTETKKYTTKKGDTLSSIAREFYGDGMKWKAIYEANREVFANPNIVPIGKEIIIPSPEIAENIATLEHPARTTYIIQKGDTLMKISERHFGDPTHWKDILNANKERIQDKDKLIPGTIIVIPDTNTER